MNRNSKDKRKGTETSPAGMLVVGYGNTLRSDDGVGPKVAEEISGLNLPGIRTLVCDLLTPELADAVSQVREVVFVDAAVDEPETVQLRPLQPAPTSQVMAHAADPKTILALARDVFGHAPIGWWLTIPVQNVGIGEELSACARSGMRQAVLKIKELSKRAGP